MLAGTSFLCRVIKNISINFDVLNISLDNYESFIEKSLEADKSVENIEKMDKVNELTDNEKDKRREKLNHPLSTNEATNAKYESDTTAYNNKRITTN